MSFPPHMHAERITLYPRLAAVIVVDMINEFRKRWGKMVLPDYDVLVPPQLAVVDAPLKAGAPVIWVPDSRRRNMRRDREFLKRPPHGEEGTWATEIIAYLATHFMTDAKSVVTALSKGAIIENTDIAA